MKRKNKFQLRLVSAAVIYSVFSGLLVFLSEYADSFRIIIPIFIALMLVVGFVIIMFVLSIVNALKKRTNIAKELFKGCIYVVVVYITVTSIMSVIFSSF